MRAGYILALTGAVCLLLWSKTEHGETVIANTLDSALPRGIRNNNPGNIDRHSHTTWRGMSDMQTDPRFVVFTDPVYGIRAIARIIRTYGKRGLTSVREIIETWAPSVENDTSAYVSAVAGKLGVSPDEAIDYDRDLPELIEAIIYHENGRQPYARSLILQGIVLERTA